MGPSSKDKGRGRSLEERFQVNLESFKELYNAFESRSKHRLGLGYADHWNAVFEMELPSADEKVADRQRTACLHLDKAVFALIEKYTLHEGVGATKNKRAKAPRYSISPVDSLDPVFWRALIEVFARTLLMGSGAPQKWNTKDFIELACDIMTVKQQSAKPLSKVALANELLKGNRSFLRTYKKSGGAKPTPRSITTRIVQLYEDYGEISASSWGTIPKKHPGEFEIIFSNWLKKHKERRRPK